MFRSKKRETQMDDLISSVRSKSVCNFTETRTDSCAPHCIQCESHEKRSGDRHACAIQWPSYGNHNENEKQHVDAEPVAHSHESCGYAKRNEPHRSKPPIVL